MCSVGSSKTEQKEYQFGQSLSFHNCSAKNSTATREVRIQQYNHVNTLKETGSTLALHLSAIAVKTLKLDHLSTSITEDKAFSFTASHSIARKRYSI